MADVQEFEQIKPQCTRNFSLAKRLKSNRRFEFDGGTIMNKKKKITILVCALFMVFSLGACGKTKEDAAVVTQQESSLQIESMDEETTSEESTTFNNGEEDDIELKDTGHRYQVSGNGRNHK